METTKTEDKRKTKLWTSATGDVNGMVPPQAVAIEKSVLGALMLDQKMLFGYIDKMHEGLFYKTEHQKIFEAIKSLVGNRREVDMLTVVEELRKEGKLEEAGGPLYVAELTRDVMSSAHLEYHTILLTEKFMQREVIRTSSENIREAYDETCDAVELVDRAEKRLMEISEKSFKSEGYTMERLVKEAEEKLLYAKEEDNYSIDSGFRELDKMTSGFQPGALIILAARPAQGKTACALSMARHIAVGMGKPVAFFSLEMTGLELLVRLLASEAEISANKLKKAATLSQDEKEWLAEKMDVLRNAPLYIDDTAGLDIFELRAKCRRLKQKRDIEIVFVDYLQLMHSSGDGTKGRNREQEISDVSRQLKEMAKELNIPVVAMAQFARRADERAGGVPTMADLRESGGIEQDADIVIGIHRPWKYGLTTDAHGHSTENLADLHILKHRAGECGTVSLQFIGKYFRFEDMPREDGGDTKEKSDGGMKANTAFDEGGKETKGGDEEDLPFA